MPNFDAPEARGSPGWPDAVVITVSASDGAAAAAAFGRLRSALAGQGPGVVVCDASSVAPCHIGTVDLVARLALTARRSGCRLVLRGAPRELRELLALAGLADVVPCAEDSALEAER